MMEGGQQPNPTVGCQKRHFKPLMNVIHADKSHVFNPRCSVFIGG
jgi:hypothetical protein